MKFFILLFFGFYLLTSFSPHSQAQTCDSFFKIKFIDPYLDYEEVRSPKVLDWARAENQKTFDKLKADPRYKNIYDQVLANSNSKDRIVYASFYEKSNIVRNFWKDEKNPQGILRETTQDKYFSGKPEWQTILDMDLLSEAEGKRWVYGGGRQPEGNSQKAMISLSDSGKDAVEFREFDFNTRQFVKDGFRLPESKSRVSWIDDNTLLVADALSEQNLTNSGYPRILKIWKRGTPYSEAVTIYEGLKEDISVSAWSYKVQEGQIETFVSVGKNFFESEIYIYKNQQMILFPVPKDSHWYTTFEGQVFLELKSDWTHNSQTFKQGSIVTFDFNEFVKTGQGVKVFLDPLKNGAVESIDSTDQFVYVTTLEDVQNRIYQYQFVNGSWSKKLLPIPDFSVASLKSSPNDSGFILYEHSGFLAAPALYKMNEATLQVEVLQSLPQRFDPSPYKVEQHFATSKDGTQIPYYAVMRKDLKLDGKNPTLQYGYGGFSVTLPPTYSSANEHAWLKDGGVYVLANIRGGGEYGPAWHQAALKENRHKAFEDFISVSEDLIAKKITSPQHLGIEGGSNGGLLTGTVTTLRPDLYSAAIIAVPLLDMLRFHKLLAGASWVAEYGSPEIPAERAYLESYSPYQNLKPSVKYPEVFLMTSTADDRVHPAHARKFAKRLEEFAKPFYYYENIEGGHGGSANNKQAAEVYALERVYLWHMLGHSNN